MNLRDKDYSILGKYFVITDTKEVFTEDGTLLGKLPKLPMTESQIQEFLDKK